MEPEPDPRDINRAARLGLLKDARENGAAEYRCDNRQSHERKDGAEGNLFPCRDLDTPENPDGKGNDCC